MVTPCAQQNRNARCTRRMAWPLIRARPISRSSPNLAATKSDLAFKLFFLTESVLLSCHLFKYSSSASTGVRHFASLFALCCCCCCCCAEHARRPILYPISSTSNRLSTVQLVVLFFILVLIILTDADKDDEKVRSSTFKRDNIA